MPDICIKIPDMPRRKHRRNIGFSASVTYFKPAGMPRHQLEEVVLEEDEIEAVRLANLEGLYHEDAAREMGISRQTFGRIIASANKKIAEGLIHGKSILISNNT
jgi:predicted DNA-binding protein (UPF0251 family)